MPGLIEMKSNPLRFSKEVDLKTSKVFKTSWSLYNSQILITLEQDPRRTAAQEQEHLNKVNEFFTHLSKVLQNMLTPTVEGPKDVSKEVKVSEASGNAQRTVEPKG